MSSARPTEAAKSAIPAELASFLESTEQPCMVMDDQYRIVAANRAYYREFGQQRLVVGARCHQVSHGIDVPCDQAGETCPLRESRVSGHAHRTLHLHHTPRGPEHVEVETTPVRDPAGRVSWFVESLRTVRHASGTPAVTGLVGRSPAFSHMLALLMRVAPTGAATLLLGETGTGKELAARLLHEASARADGPFVVVDCSGLTETLFESELFGHEKGAFTGAGQRKAGLVQAAHGGTLFLDEVGDIPLGMQVKLLRLLETGTYRRVGGLETLRCDFRLVSATHRDLAQMVTAESFRRDLYHRIATFPVRVPALAERPQDLALLAQSLLQRCAGTRAVRLSEAAQELLHAIPFPGNIRQLRNLLERAAILADGEVIDTPVLQAALAQDATVTGPAAPGGPRDGFHLDRPLALQEVERRYLLWAEAACSGDRATLAGLLGLPRRTLYRKLADARRTGAKAPGEDPG